MVEKGNRNLEAKEIISSSEIPQEGRSLRPRGIPSMKLDRIKIKLRGRSHYRKGQKQDSMSCDSEPSLMA